MKKAILTGTSAILVVLLAIAGGAAQEREQQQQEQQQPEQPQAPPTPQPGEEERAAVLKVLGTTDPEQRVALGEDFLSQYPESPLRGRAYAAVAQGYRMQNNYAKAVEYGERALELAPRDAVSMLLVADSLAESSTPEQADFQERLAKGEDYARRGLELLPDLFAGMRRRPEVPAEQYEEQERFIEGQAHAILGSIYLRRDQFTEAEEELKRAAELTTMRPNPADFQRLGYAHLRQKEYADAETAFQRCVELGGAAGETCQKQLDAVRQLLITQPAPK
ncbi:MAG: tetratricopeptide repeat protein, partial [Armatimonadota bacterium]